MFDLNTYRAKDLQSAKWVFGAYKKHLPYQPNPMWDRDYSVDEVHYIITDGSADWGMPRRPEIINVDPDTVCKCIGKQDFNGNYIFENDILQSYLTEKIIGTVEWDQQNCRYIVTRDGKYATDFSQLITEETIVAKNIFETRKDK